MWAPRGQTPVLNYNFNWKSLSAVAGLTMWNFYFRIYAGSVKSPQVVEFLEALVRHIQGPLLLVWDGLPRTVAAWFATTLTDWLDGSISNTCRATRQS